MLGRDSEIKVLEDYRQRSGNQVMVMYGFYGVGKTTLVEEWIKDIPGSLLFDCGELFEREQLYQWSRFAKLPFELPDYPNYNDLFVGIRDYCSDKEGKSVLVFDEFQNLLKYSNNFTNYLFDFLSKVQKEYLVILISSSIDWVENSMVGKIGMAARGISGFFKVKELGFKDFRAYFPKFKYEEAVTGYAVLGGIPKLWNYFDTSKNLKENIINNILSKEAPLLTYGEEFVGRELREMGVYNTILCSLAEGKKKLNELYNHTLFSRAKISVYIKNLMELGFVRKEFSVDTEGRSNTQKGVYDISCNYVDFTYQFLYRHRDELRHISAADYYNEYIRGDLKRYVAKYFPNICKEYLDSKNAAGELPVKYTRMGSWIGKAGTIDFVCKDSEGKILVAMCNWDKPMMRYSDYEKLIYCCKQAKVVPDYYYLFSTGDFDEQLHIMVKSKNNVKLVDVDNL